MKSHRRVCPGDDEGPGSSLTPDSLHASHGRQRNEPAGILRAGGPAAFRAIHCMSVMEANGMVPPADAAILAATSRPIQCMAVNGFPVNVGRAMDPVRP